VKKNQSQTSVYCLVFLVFALIATRTVFAQVDGSKPTSSATDLPSLDAVKNCLAAAQSAECLDNLFRQALKTHSTKEVLALLQRFENQDPDLRRDCHPVVHAVGRETFKAKGNIHESFSACDQTCHSGCYHGSVERFLRGDNLYSQVDQHPSQAELKRKATAACDPGIAVILRFQCLHGLGHALLFFSRYQLAASLEICDVLAEDWSRRSCYGGVFMENVFNSTPELRDVSATDYHYPCNKIDSRYRSECYLMQTSRMAEMGLTERQLFDECQKAGEYSSVCTLSVGRDLSNEVRTGRERSTAEKCEIVTGERRLACMRGVVFALIDNTWDGRYALPFCTTFSAAGDQRTCLQESFHYMQTTIEKSADEIRKDCSQNLKLPVSCSEFVGS
jgi:uncharacterized protein YgiB involved in biofilm formation